MAKLYVFGIGGTGSRILRSLTMMMAAGVKIGVDEIVPIIIDPDASNGDLTRTVTLMDNYRAIRSKLDFAGGNNSTFFKTDIQQTLPNYLVGLRDTSDKLFRQFINYAGMSRENKALVKMLFSEKNLESSMEIGFKGNPNIGSVVLNQLVDSPDFNAFANSFTQGDKIFIISSIFGGTGASGFPLLLKTLRTSKRFANHALINNAPIGAITVLPYFRLKQSDKSEIDSSTFISKTKSALAYYEKNISNNGTINSLYFIGDDVTNTYDNNEGGSFQANDAHLIEFLGATAILDFANSHSVNVGTTNKELGLNDLTGSVSFDKFSNVQRNLLYDPFVQFTLFCNSILDNRTYFQSTRFAANEYLHFDYGSSFFSDLVAFFTKYRDWLEELKRNNRSLDLFNNNCGKFPFELVTGVKPRKILSKYSNYDLIAARLNSAVKNCNSKSTENKFMEMFYIGTQRLVKEKL